MTRANCIQLQCLEETKLHWLKEIALSFNTLSWDSQLNLCRSSKRHHERFKSIYQFLIEAWGQFAPTGWGVTSVIVKDKVATKIQGQDVLGPRNPHPKEKMKNGVITNWKIFDPAIPGYSSCSSETRKEAQNFIPEIHQSVCIIHSMNILCWNQMIPCDKTICDYLPLPPPLIEYRRVWFCFFDCKPSKWVQST